jgi:hypothetical protein
MVVIFFLLRPYVKGAQPSVRKRKRELNLATGSRRHRYVHKVLAIDFVGATLLIGGAILLLLGLNWGSTTSTDLEDVLGGHGRSGWSAPKVVASLTIGGALLVLTVVWEYLIEHFDVDGKESPTILLDAEPILPIPVLRNWDTVICNYVSLTSGMVMLVFFYFVAIFFTVSPSLLFF